MADKLADGRKDATTNLLKNMHILSNHITIQENVRVVFLFLHAIKY